MQVPNLQAVPNPRVQNANKIIDGTAAAAALDERCKKIAAQLKQKYDFTPGLAVILVGNNAASKIYVTKKQQRAQEIGINSRIFEFPDTISQAELTQFIDKLNNDNAFNGILIQLPLPAHINVIPLLSFVRPEKDVDGFCIINSGMLFSGMRYGVIGPVVPCTPLGCLRLIKAELGNNLSGLRCVVIGSSNIVGKPMAMLMMQEGCTVTIAHSRTKNLAEHTRAADIVISATGVPGLIKGDMLKEGSFVVDVGIVKVKTAEGKTRTVGDVDFNSCLPVVSKITPVPGGVGPMTVSCLMENTILLALRQRECIDELVEYFME